MMTKYNGLINEARKRAEGYNAVGALNAAERLENLATAIEDIRTETIDYCIRKVQALSLKPLTIDEANGARWAKRTLVKQLEGMGRWSDTMSEMG